MGVTQAKLPLEFGRYVLVKRIAEGGMAEVFLGLAQGLGSFRKLVAMKCLHSHLASSEKFVEMFLDEARLAACLTHMNIVQTFDVGYFGGTYYIAMEYVHGVSLFELLQDRPFPLDVGVNLALGIATGLAFAHDAKDEHGKKLAIVHRDIAPKNVLVSYAGEVKLTDFGIAKASVQSHVTKTGEIKGTMGYMPLEQLEGTSVDACSDVYATGGTFFEIFTGRRFSDFTGKTHGELLKRQPRENIPPPSTLNGKIPKELDAIILKALAADPDARYANGGELLSSLRDLAVGLSWHPNPEVIASWLSEKYPEDAKKPPLPEAEFDSLQQQSNPSSAPETATMLPGALEMPGASGALKGQGFSGSIVDAEGPTVPGLAAPTKSHLPPGATKVQTTPMDNTLR